MNAHRIRSQIRKKFNLARLRPFTSSAFFACVFGGCFIYFVFYVVTPTKAPAGVDLEQIRSEETSSKRNGTQSAVTLERLREEIADLKNDKARLKQEVMRLQSELQTRIQNEVKREEDAKKESEKRASEVAPDDKSKPAAAPGKEDLHAADLPKQEAVKKAFLHGWSGYEKYAFGKDEIKPISKWGNDAFGGLGATLVDSLDTMFIMGLKDELQRARNWVATEFSVVRGDVSTFETTIRILGGLLSAYDLTEDRMYLDKAKDLGDRLLKAFDTPTGIPHATVDLTTGRSHSPDWSSGSATLSEFGTLQLEFNQLAFHTGETKYADKVNVLIDILDRLNISDGLYGMFMDTNTGRFTNDYITFGARGDSTYEYFLKMWVLLGKPTNSQHRRMYDASMDGMTRLLIQSSTPSHLVYVAELDQSRKIVHKMDHLVCFVPGMLALGAQGATAAAHMQLAKDIIKTCVEFYKRYPTGLSPELVKFYPDKDFATDSHHNLLRPETVESLFILHRFTHDPIYRQWGWDIFQAFEKYAKTEIGYSGLRDVRQTRPTLDDRCESFFFAETLKYLYLLFSDDSLIPLDKWVFNTEAHPLRIRSAPPPAAA